MAELRCRELRKTFGGVTALDNVTVRFSEAGIVAIVGPNGAGKTTFLNVLTGFVPLDAGSCSLGELDITGLPPHRIARLGIARTFQDVRLIADLSVLDNVLLATAPRETERILAAMCRRKWLARQEAIGASHARDVLASVGLADCAFKKAGELSYGQQKLLTLACCVATDARILLLDEPVSGVHPALIERIAELVVSLRDGGKLVVFVEHNLDIVRSLAEVVFVMDQGGIIADGSCSDVLSRPDVLEAYVT